jgi:hypothetical protein
MKKVEAQNLDALLADQSKGPRLVALPVWYHGYRFRSRAEGRWAVFFEHMGIEYQYEPQGFKLENGVCYLPDFFLPVTRSWAEVKGFDATFDERAKCESVIRELGGTFLILAGPPDFRSYEGLSLDCGEINECRYSLDIGSHRQKYYEQHRFFSDPDPSETEEIHVSEVYKNAVYKSRGERFDQREFPKPGHEPFNLSERELRGEE